MKKSNAITTADKASAVAPTQETTSLNADFQAYMAFLEWQKNIKGAGQIAQPNPVAEQLTPQQKAALTRARKKAEKAAQNVQAVTVQAVAPAKVKIELSVMQAGKKSVEFTGKGAEQVYSAYVAKYPNRWTPKTANGFQVGATKQNSVLRIIETLNK